MQLKPLDYREKLDRETFQREYFIPQRPVIFRSFAANWPALENWNYPRFKQLAGEAEVEVFGHWKSNQPTRIKMPAERKMTFAEYIDLIHEGPNDFRLFLFNIFKHAPTLKRDFHFPDFADGWVKSVPVLFFGGEGSDVRLHYDIDHSNVFLTQFHGQKRVTLFSPEMSPYLYKQPMSSHSNVDLRQPDYEHFPALRQARGYTGVLHHGDTVFMPSSWWHYNEYLTTGYGMALRSLHRSALKQMKGVYNVLVMRKIDDLISKYYAQEWASWKERLAQETGSRVLQEEE